MREREIEGGDGDRGREIGEEDPGITNGGTVKVHSTKLKWLTTL